LPSGVVKEAAVLSEDEARLVLNRWLE
jgi:hypothetical protein